MPDIFTSPKEKPQEKVPYGLPVIEGDKTRIAFKAYPEKINFETKDKDEKIILMLRQHPTVNISWILISLAILMTPFLLQKVGVLSLLPSGYSLVIKMVFALVALTYAIEGFYKWYFNVFFITNKRVMDVDFDNLINRRVSDAELKNIQDVTYTTRGAMGTLFNFGDVIIQTASEIPELDFTKVPSPEKVANVLDDLRNIKG